MQCCGASGFGQYPILFLAPDIERIRFFALEPEHGFSSRRTLTPLHDYHACGFVANFRQVSFANFDVLVFHFFLSAV
jgi:hypothetical protein